MWSGDRITGVQLYQKRPLDPDGEAADYKLRMYLHDEEGYPDTMYL